jgi:hypothetical protein
MGILRMVSRYVLGYPGAGYLCFGADRGKGQVSGAGAYRGVKVAARLLPAGSRSSRMIGLPVIRRNPAAVLVDLEELAMDRHRIEAVADNQGVELHEQHRGAFCRIELTHDRHAAAGKAVVAPCPAGPIRLRPNLDFGLALGRQ